MATIAENLQKIVDIKENIKTAIENKGVTVGDSSFTDYPTLINNIPQENTGGDITLTNIDITTNGTYTAPDGEGYKTINVDVPTGGDTTTYSYKTPTADIEGLKALGWDDESIGYFRDNNLCYEWQKDNYIVTDGNKELYGVITKDNISLHKSDPNFIYCPMIDTSNVTTMSRMFDGCKSLTTIPLLDTSNVTSMYYTFNGCKSLTTIPLLDCGNVTTMNYMFNGCSSLTTIPLLDTSNVTDMYGMFDGCSLLTIIPELNTSNVTDMERMFASCSSLTTIPELNTSNVTDMYSMFSSCSSLQSIPLLNCGNVTRMDIFFGYLNINTLTYLGGFKDLKISVTSGFLERTSNLTVESLMNVINNIYDLTANGLSGQSLKFGSTNLNKLTDEQIAVATAKGWTLTA